MPLNQNFQTGVQAQANRLDWSLSVTDFGQIAQGVNDISQCILIAVATKKGSDPFRPDFGSNIWDHIDNPVQVAAPAMVREIREAVERWEPRVRLTGVDYTLEDLPGDLPGTTARVVFSIGWELAGGNIQGNTDILFGQEDPGDGSTVPSPLFVVLATEANDPLATENDELLLIEP